MGYNKLTTVMELVKDYLEAKPLLRDSDNKLVCRIWNNLLEAKGSNPKEASAHDLLCLISQDKLPSFESISRARRKIQEQYPHLRGNTYKQRQNESKIYRDNINK